MSVPQVVQMLEFVGMTRMASRSHADHLVHQPLNAMTLLLPHYKAGYSVICFYPQALLRQFPLIWKWRTLASFSVSLQSYFRILWIAEHNLLLCFMQWLCLCHTDWFFPLAETSTLTVTVVDSDLNSGNWDNLWVCTYAWHTVNQISNTTWHFVWSSSIMMWLKGSLRGFISIKIYNNWHTGSTN